MIGIDRLMGEGRDAFIAHHFHGQPLESAYRKGTKRFFWWSRGVQRTRSKVSEMMEIGR